MKLKFSIAIATIATAATLTGCTIYLPPSEEPIPAADPIIVPGKATTVKPEDKDLIEIDPSKSKPAKTTPKAKKEPSRQGQIFYIVKPKDTVFEVMRKTGVPWKDIIRLNKLKAPGYTIFPGQNLRIR